MLKMSQDEMRRRCLLGVGGVAERIWIHGCKPLSSSDIFLYSKNKTTGFSLTLPLGHPSR